MATTDVGFYDDHIRPAADFIVDHGPNYEVERWEEHPGYSPSTPAAEIAGLVAASHLLSHAAGDSARERLYLATADDYPRNVKRLSHKARCTIVCCSQVTRDGLARRLVEKPTPERVSHKVKTPETGCDPMP